MYVPGHWPQHARPLLVEKPDTPVWQRSCGPAVPANPANPGIPANLVNPGTVWPALRHADRAV